MLLLQVATLVVGISLLAPIEARLGGDNAGFLGADPNAPSSKGNEFFLGFMGNTANAPIDSASASLLVTTDDPAPVEFTVEYFGTMQTGEAIKGDVFRVILPVGETTDIRVNGEDERNKGIRVKATDPTKLLTVYGINDAEVSTDAFLALPCHRYPVTQYKYFVFSTSTVSMTGTFRSRFLIVPCEDTTSVTIRPTQQIQANTDLTGLPVPTLVNAGDQVIITVNRLQTAQFNSDMDLTGTVIESDKPISVFVGHECGQVPSGRTACDHLVEQIPPDATWGTQFFTAPLDVRESGERYRVGSVVDNNQVTVTCTTEGQSSPSQAITRTLQSQRGQNYMEFDTVGDTSTPPDGVTPNYRREYCCIETTKPAIVMMYSKGHSLDEITLQDVTGTQGDPFMLLIPPLSQYSNDYTATTAKQVNTGFLGHISLTLPIQFFDNSTVSRNRLTVNGTTYFPDSGYSPILCSNNQICGYGAYSELPVGSHQVNYNMPGAAMNLFVYGFLREISFGYPTGFEMQPVGVPRITIFNITVLESAGTVRIPINRTGGDLSVVSVIRAVSRDVPGQAVVGEDYVRLADRGDGNGFRIRWQADQVDPRYIPTPTRNDPAFEIAIVDDSIPESPREYFEIDLTLNPTGSNRNGFFYPRAVGRVTIIDDDIATQIGFDPASYSYDEAAGVARLTITTNMPLRFTDATGALFYTEDGNATAADYTGVARANAVPITFPAGSTETVIEVPITNDQLVEGTERFLGQIITGGGISDLEIFAPTATVDITDNDNLVFGFEQPSYTFSESVGIANLGVRLSPDSGMLSMPLVFTFTTEDDSASAPGDYTSATTEYTFMPGDTRLDIPVTIMDDSNFEGQERFLGMLSTSNPNAVIDVPMTEVFINDNDRIPIGFDPVSYTRDEGDGFVDLTFRKFSNPPSLMENITVVFSTADGTAEAGPAGDYIARSGVEVTFLPEEETKTVRVMINDDSNLENLENFFGNLMISSDSASIAEVTVPQATVDINDNDERIEVGFDPTMYSVTEGGTATLTVVLNMAYTEDITVSLQTNPGSAGDPDDYTGVTTVVTFPAGQTTQTVDVPTIDDNDSEGTESFTATLSNASPSDVVFITEDTATINITDNDNVPVTFDRPSYTVDESSSTVRICFSTTAGHPDRDITVMIQPRQLRDGDPCTDHPTATVNSDFDGSSYSQTFSASSMGGQLCADIDLIPDILYEGDEQFIVEFTNVPDSANRVDVGAISQTCVTIVDDDELTFNFETPNITIPEPNGPAEICIVMTGRTTVPINVTATTGPKSGAPDQATAGSDYETTTFTLEFTSSDEGTTTRCANVPIIDDQLGNELVEPFSVSFVSISPAGRQGPDSETCVFIEDDDVPEIIWIDRNVTIPEGEYMELCFMSDIGTAVPYDVTVDVRAKGGNPASAADYMVESVLDFTFSSMDPGEVMCVNVSAVDDDIDEPTEQFEFYFTPILDNALVTFGDPSTACVNIQDNDMPLAQWEVPEVNIPEGDTQQVCFIRTADSAQSYEIQVGVRGKGPRPATGADYSVLTDLNFVIEPSSLNRRHCIALSIVQDEIGEGMEQFEFFFENLPNEMAGVGTPATTCVNIIDDDVVEVNIDMVNVTVPESDPMVEICFSLSSGISESIVVTAETRPKDGANQATAGSDYSSTTLMVMFPPSAGGQMVCENVPIMDDILGNEGDELFSVIITSVSSDKIMIGPNDESCVTILDDDMPVIEWDDSVVNITEGGSRQICFSSDIGSDVPYEVIVGVRQKGSPALRGTDYTIDSSLTVPIAATNSGDQFCLNVNTIQDNIAEGTEQFELYFENLPSEFATAGMRDTVCVSIVDDEDPEVNINIPNINVPEEQPEVEICISVNTGFAQQVVVTIETGPKAGSSNPATADVDYETTTQLLTFMPSANGQSVCGRVPITDDRLANEGTEPFSVRITSVSNSRLRIGQNAETCVNIIDNDVPVITWDDSQVTIPEGENRQVCFSSDIGTAQPYDVMVGAREKGTSPATQDVDYSLPAQSLSVTFSSMNGEQFCIDISTIQDTIGEGTEQFELYFENLPSAFANAGDPDVLCVNIEDDDVPVVDVEQPNISVPENETEVEVCLRLSTGITEQVIVTVATEEKTGALGPLATAGVDYVSTTRMLTFVPSDDRQRVCTTVPLTDDNLDEPNELFSVRIIDISPENSVMMGPNSESCVTIIDDDVPVISWDEPEVDVPEGGNRQVCFSSDIGTVQPYDVMVGAREKGASPATRDVDYSLPAQSLSVTFSSMNGERFCINISANEDTIGEDTEQFELYFENLPSMSALAGDPDVLCVNIQDNDVPTVIVERPNVTVPENETEVEICLILSTGIVEQVVVTAETGPKTGAADQATADSDYATTTLMITFEPSSDGQSVCGPVPIIDDLLDEANELFSVRITSISNPGIMVGMNAETCVTIIDDDVPEFNIGPPMVNVTEPEGMVEVCITTNSPLARNIVVTAVTGPKSGATNQATADADYNTTTIMVTFMPSDQGVQEFCGFVPIKDDDIGNEPNEELSVTLISSDPPGAKFGDRESCITIIDDDVVGINFSTTDVVVNENNGTVTVCLTKNITTDGPIRVVFDAEEETDATNAASDTTDFQPGLGTVVFQPNDTEACGQVLIKDDNTPENPEVFMVTFTVPNLVIPRPPELEPPVAEVTIIDDDNIDILTCQFDEIQQVQRFTQTSDYRFMGTCEYTAASSCNAIPGFDVRVTVDYISETLENGAVGLHVNNLRYVSREDGSFDDGGQTPQSSTPSGDVYSAGGDTLVRVSMGPGQTNITFDSNTPSNDPLDADIFIVHNWDDVDPTILISIRTPNNSAISDFCGLCGSRSGSLLRRDGTEADAMNPAEVQSFITSYAVPARDQLLRPQRRECGIVRNDTVIGDPLYAAPVYTEDGREYSLCYEVFGRANSTLNLVSDTCVNVNARYGPMDNPEEGNIIRAVGVRAKGLSDSSCHNIRVDLEGCSANIETPDGNSQSLASMESFESDGISVRKYPRRVRISAPNCENVMLVMWVICENRNNQDMIKFVIARGLNLRPSSHGLLGQFWNIPVTYTRYNGSADLPAGTDPSRVYVVTVRPESSPARSFLGHFYHLKWDKTREPCLYVGNAQGGPSYEVPDPNDSVIEGRYKEYILQGGDENLFATSYTYSQFEEGRCN